MANAETRKRARADDVVPEEHRPNKRIKSEGKHYEPSNFPPEFWDNLSKVPLTRRALRELDRRNSARPAPGPAAPAVYTAHLARFARHGGPDLRHLRGCPQPKGAVCTMASSRSTSSRRTKSTKSAKATDVSSNTKPTSAYDDAFEQHMIDNSIYPPFYDFPDNRPTLKPNNLSEDRRVLSTSRPSLSPSHFTETAFEDFQRKNRTASESTVKRNVIPIITGNSDIPNKGDLYFINIEPMTGGPIVKAMPDFFDGARAGDIHNKIRNADEKGNLNKLIIPTKHASAPVAPNFFLESKAHGGGAVALRQALHDGAIGARAMHALQNYGAEEPAFDGNAYTYSSTYHAGTGTLKLYAHHATPPIAPGGRPEYHMTQVDGWDLTGNIDTFRRGVTAFRNARDLAQRHRNSLIQTANTRARQSNAEPPPEAEITVAEQSKELASDNFVDCEEYAGSQAIGTENYAIAKDVEEVPARPQYLYAEDEEPSQESTTLGEPTISFATSFTSSFTAQSQTSSKRNRASNSPPSNSRPRKKHDPAKKQDSAKY
ncbi:uncharacterized protein B0T15DRAFT_250724 [Chaetomium strumarium]|uniref:Uncharacterized protein n=1 Tax=Chaetomium strumarium TaxID=1170767 RepID=A0AAJ0GRE7_9PEZI|nr:hypothetical protein B0T15DRAFT_250724 [Chaetomium strumarium]